MKDVGLFEYINSIGVLHHLFDPKKGLKVLSSLLRPGEILHLFLYLHGGRWGIQRIQRVLRFLGVFSDKKSLSLARQLLTNLPKGNLLHTNFEEKWSFECKADQAFADMYLHPHETSFSIRNIFD